MKLTCNQKRRAVQKMQQPGISDGGEATSIAQRRHRIYLDAKDLGNWLTHSRIASKATDCSRGYSVDRKLLCWRRDLGGRERMMMQVATLRL
jgi:hypothetical protein